MKKLILVLLFMSIAASFGIFSADAQNVPAGFHLYTVKSGDTFWGFYGNKFNKKLLKLILDVNRVDKKHLLYVDRQILLPDDPENLPDFCPVPKKIQAAKVEKRKVYVFLKEQYFAAYKFGKLEFWGPVSTADGKIDRVTKRRHHTSVGIFSVMGKHKKYFSHKKSCYGAPMPYSLRLTKGGLFMHQQSLPGYPASHGCIRTLRQDAKKLFQWIHLRDPVEVVASTQTASAWGYASSN